MVKDKQTSYLFSGGLAEFVYEPTQITFSYLAHWFTGKGSLGKAMALLNLPYSPTHNSLLKMSNESLVTDLKKEEEALYKKTIFTYKRQINHHQTPKLVVSYSKLLNPLNYGSTLKIIATQSQWLANPEKVVTRARNFLETIPETKKPNPNLVLTEEVWPYVLAIGFLSEFLNQYLAHENKKQKVQVDHYIATEVSKRDWFFLSLSEQVKVKNKKLSLKSYLKKYGLRADKDYELTSPRWSEIPDEITNRIAFAQEITNKKEKVEIPKKLKRFVDTAIELQILRSDAKRKTLFWINLLRAELIESGVIPASQKIPSLKKKKTPTKSKGKTKTAGQGRPVSSGEISGPTLLIEDNYQNIPPGTVGIFPNASPEFAPQFPKCSGLIFLAGGQTSHGAIVAREYGIPALIDPEATTIPDHSPIRLDGKNGKWEILPK